MEASGRGLGSHGILVFLSTLGILASRWRLPDVSRRSAGVLGIPVIAAFGFFLLLPAVGIEREGFPSVAMLFIVLGQAAGMKIISSVVFPSPEPPVVASASCRQLHGPLG